MPEQVGADSCMLRACGLVFHASFDVCDHARIIYACEYLCRDVLTRACGRGRFRLSA